MIKILQFIFWKMVFPVFFTVAFGLYHAFYPVLWLKKTPRKDFKREYGDFLSDIRLLTFALILISVLFCVYYLGIVIL
jgi:hypothetical protein